MSVIAALLLLFLYVGCIRVLAGVAGFSEEEMKTKHGKKRLSREQRAASTLRWFEDRAKQSPSQIEAMLAFNPVFDILRGIQQSGEVDVIDGRPVMRGWSPGEYFETAAALDGWVSCWNRIVAGEKLSLDMSSMARIQQCLTTGDMIEETTLSDAINVTHDCYQAYRKIPRHRLQEYCKEELIQIEVDRLSLSTTKDN